MKKNADIDKRLSIKFVDPLLDRSTKMIPLSVLVLTFSLQFNLCERNTPSLAA